MFETNFSGWDWMVVAVYLSGSLGIGILANRYIHSISSYLVGGRAAGTSLNVATYIGTGLGLVTLMYSGIDGFSRGFSYITVAFIGFTVSVLVGSSGFVIRPLRRMRLLTIPEFFGRRYRPGVRILAGSICALAGVLNMGLFPKMGATFITFVTGIGGDDPASAAMTVNLITSALILLVLFYTVLGGMVSVMVTDYIQFLVLSFGMGLGVYFVLAHPDLGWGTMSETIAHHRGERMFNPLATGGYGWVWLLFNILLFTAATVCWAPDASRALTARDEKGTMRTFLLASPAQFVRAGIPVLWAIAAFCMVSRSPELTAHFFPEGLAEDPLPARAGGAMPLLLGKILPVGLLGVFTAGMMAAFMSTHDSYFLCWASIIARDVVSPMTRSRLTERQEIKVTRICIIFIGIFLMVWGVWYELPESVWTYMMVTGTIYLSGAATALIGGIYWKRASSTGAVAALAAGLLSILGIDPILNLLNRLLCESSFGFQISKEVLGLFNYIFCVIVFVLFSLLFPDREVKTAEKEGS